MKTIKFKKGSLHFDKFFKHFFLIIDICTPDHPLTNKYQYCKNCDTTYFPSFKGKKYLRYTFIRKNYGCVCGGDNES
ncbi:hypothetical protein M0R19_03830 [Candidatus Pacearchaeota archaeon]|jgi:hypothetical protein|nr:hypothetical protein [Candidatus Pacearchaeota archaeon]